MSPRVLLLTTARDVIGGAEEGLLGVLRHYPPDHLEPVLVAPPGGEMQTGAAARGVRFLPWRPDRLPLGLRPQKILPFIRALRGGVRELEPLLDGVEVITTHSMEAHGYGAELARRSRLPLVWHIRDIHDPPGERWALRILERRGAPRPVFLSEAARSASPLSADGPVIGDGLDLTRFEEGGPVVARPRTDDSRPAFRIGYLGQLVPRKGLDTLFDALDVLTAERPDTAARVRVEIAGDGPDRPGPGYPPALRARATKASWKNPVRFLGRVRDIPDRLAAWDALVLPSRHEALGLVVLEAMAAGKPVIGCRDAGIAEPVRDGIEGLLVPPDDAPSLAAAVAALAEDPDAAAAFGAAGRDRVRADYDAARLAADQAAFHASCAAGTPA